MDRDGAVGLTDHHDLVASRFLRCLQLVGHFIGGMSIGKGEDQDVVNGRTLLVHMTISFFNEFKSL
jgi:hypothetical protein